MGLKKKQSGSGGSTIKGTITSGNSDNISNTHPSHLTLAGSDSKGQGDDNGTPKSPHLQVCQSDHKASTSSKLPPADKDGSGPGGDSGGGSDRAKRVRTGLRLGRWRRLRRRHFQGHHHRRQQRQRPPVDRAKRVRTGLRLGLLPR